MTNAAPTRRWIAYLPAEDGDLNPSVGAGDTEAEAIEDGQRIVTSEQIGDPAEVYALCFDLYPYVAAVPDDLEIHTRGPEYLDGEHEAGVLVEG